MPTIPKLHKIEIQLLREITEPGSQDIAWGAGMTITLESLRKRGLITNSFEPELTHLGQHVLGGLPNG